MALLLLVLALACGLPGAEEAEPIAQPATTRADGTITIDGQPWFPWGFRHAAGTADTPRIGADLAADVEAMAAAGFDCLALPLDPADPESCAPALAACTRLGLRVIDLGQDPSASSAWVADRACPAIVGLALGDEVNVDRDPQTPEIELRCGVDELRARQRALRSLLPGMLGWAGTGGDPRLPLAGYIGACDVLAVPVCPIGDPAWGQPSYELEAADDCLQHQARTCPPSQSFVAQAQAFAWPGREPPSPADLRILTALALIRGARGLVWNSWYPVEAATPLPERLPAQWTELQLLSLDRRLLLPVVCSQERQEVHPDPEPFLDGRQGAWHAAIWTGPDSLHVLVASTRRLGDLVARIPLPVPVTGAPRAWIPNRGYGIGLELKNGSLVGVLTPASVHAYVIDRPQPPPARGAKR